MEKNKSKKKYKTLNKREKRRLVFRIILGVIILVIVVTTVIGVIKSRNDLSAGNVISAILSLWTEDKPSDTFEYERSSGVCRLSGGIASVSENGIRTFDRDGDEELMNSFTMLEPHMKAGKDTAIAYDAGGTLLKYFALNTVIKEIETEAPIISASINDDGWFAIATQETSYTSSVTVYNTKATAVYRWYAGSGYILKAEIDDDDKSMTVLSLSESGSELTWLKFSSEEEQGRLTFPGEVLIDFEPVGGSRIAAVTENEVIFIDSGKGEETSRYDFGGRLLTGYDLSFGKNILLALSEDRFADAETLVSVKTDGKEVCSAETDARVKDLDCTKRNCVVLTENGVTVYDRSLRVKDVYGDAEGEWITAEGKGDILAAGEYMAKYVK